MWAVMRIYYSTLHGKFFKYILSDRKQRVVMIDENLKVCSRVQQSFIANTFSKGQVIA